MINKFFVNENGAGAVALMIALTVSLLFSSVVIAWFVTEMQIGGNIQEIQLPDSLSSYSSEQNFASGTYDLETLKKSGSSEWSFVDGVGLRLDHTSGDTSYLYIDYIIPDSTHTVTNYYTINNSQHKDFSIVLGNAGAGSNELMVKSDGFHFPAFLITGNYNGWDMDFIPFNNPLQYDEVKIKTVYTEGLRVCPFLQTCYNSREPYVYFEFNGNSYSTSDLNVPEVDGINIYGGVAGWSTGLAVKDFKTDNSISGSVKTSNDALTYVSSLIDTMLDIIVWGLPEEIMPAILQLLLIRTQEFGILVCVASVLIRGVG